MKAFILTTFPCYRAGLILDLASRLPGGMPIDLVHGPNIRTLGADWETSCLDYDADGPWHSMTDGAGSICCGQGHLNIWRKILEDKDETEFLVFEDDAVIPQNQAPDLTWVLNFLPKTYDWAMLHHSSINERIDKVYPERANRYWRKCQTHHMGSIAYAITRKGAEHLAKVYTPICATPDHIMQIASSERECYVATNPIVRHHGDTPSVIGLAHLKNTYEEPFI